MHGSHGNRARARELKTAHRETSAARDCVQRTTHRSCGGQTAEDLSREFRITRRHRDAFSLRRRQRAIAARERLLKALGLERALGEIPEERLNVNGGAIALGHPVGASGARLLLTTLHEMRRRGARLGLASLCVGGGQGAAFVLERA